MAAEDGSPAGLLEPFVQRGEPDGNVASTSALTAGESEHGDTEAPKLLPRPPSDTLLDGTAWLGTASILLADMFGLGTLSLPSDFARLGWVPALAGVGAFAAADVYSATLYQRLSLAHPDAVVLDTLGERALGRLGRGLVYCTTYLTLLWQPTIFHLTCVDALVNVFWAQGLSSTWASVLVTLMILPMSQVQQMHDVAWLAIAGTAGMTLAVLVIVGRLLVMYAQAGGGGALAAAVGAGGGAADALLRATAGGGVAAPHTEWFGTEGLSSALVGLMDIAFAYGGQANWMRYITTMRRRAKFTAAVGMSAALMTLMFLAVGVVGYAVLGSDVDHSKPISSVLARDGWLVVVNAGIFLHCIFAYQINVNVWAASALQIWRGGAASAPAAEPGRWRSRAVWMCLTCSAVAFGAVTSWLLPFFSLVMACIAALGDVMSMLGLPCLFALRLLRLRSGERVVCAVLVVASMALASWGLSSSVEQLVAAWQQSHSGGADMPALPLGLPRSSGGFT